MDERVYQQILTETNKAIKRGYDHTKVQWRKMALGVIYELCMSKETFTANDFTNLIKANPIKTHDNRSIGGIIKMAVRLKWVAGTGQKEFSKAGHLSNIEIWKSLLYGKPLTYKSVYFEKWDGIVVKVPENKIEEFLKLNPNAVRMS